MLIRSRLSWEKSAYLGWKASSIGEKVNGNFNYDIITLPKTPSGKMIGINFIIALGVNKASTKQVFMDFIKNEGV